MARTLVTLIFQKQVTDEYLPTILHPLIQKLVVGDGRSFLYRTRNVSNFDIPPEFSKAVFRFGHAMIKQKYRMKGGETTFHLAEITRRGQALEGRFLIDWEQFFDFGNNDFQRASRIDLEIAAGTTRIEQDYDRYLNNERQWDSLNEDTYGTVPASSLSPSFRLKGLVLGLDEHSHAIRYLKGDINLKNLRSNLVSSHHQITDQPDPTQPFKNIIVKDLVSGSGIPTGGDIVRALVLSRPQGVGGMGTLTEILGIDDLRTTEFFMDFRKSEAFDKAIRRPLRVNNVPLWLYSLREAEVLPFTDRCEIRKYPSVNENCLGPLSSLIIAETIMQAVRKPVVNIYASWSKILKNELGILGDFYLDLVGSHEAVNMARIINLTQKMEKQNDRN